MYLVGSFVLVSLAGCGRGFFQSAEREPWRAEAEITCLKSGAVKENADLVRINPISGPGICGAEYPLKVAALGEGGGSLGFADEASGRPQASAISRAGRSRSRLRLPRQSSSYPDAVVRQPATARRPRGPISLTAPGVAAQQDEIDLPPEGTPGLSQPGAQRQYPGPYRGTPAYPPRERYSAPYPARPVPPADLPQAEPLPRLGPAQGNSVSSVRAGRGQAGGDAGLSDRLGARSLARRFRAARSACAGSARAWSRSSRSPPIPAAA